MDFALSNSSPASSDSNGLPESTGYMTTESLAATATCPATSSLGTSVRDGGIGAVVGVTVGMLLGAVAVWFYLQKQRRQQRQQSDLEAETQKDLEVSAHPEEELSAHPQEAQQMVFTRYATLKELQMANEGDVTAEQRQRDLEGRIYPDEPDIIVKASWRLRERYRYQLYGEGDAEIPSMIKMQCTSIKLCAERFYHDEELPEIPDSFDESLRRLGLGEAVTSNLRGLLIDQDTRHLAITHLIVRVIFTNLDVHAIGPLSLLPTFITEFLQSIPCSYDHINDRSRRLEGIALASWRQVSVYLMQHDKIHLGLLHLPSSIEPQIIRLRDALQDVVGIFAREDGSEITQLEILETSIRESATLGYRLFSNSTELKYVFEPEPSREDGILIVPGLAKLTNHDGEPYEKPWMMRDCMVIEKLRTGPVVSISDTYGVMKFASEREHRNWYREHMFIKKDLVAEELPQEPPEEVTDELRAEVEQFAKVLGV